MSYICGHMSKMKKIQSSDAGSQVHEAEPVYLSGRAVKKKVSSGSGFDFARFFADKIKIDAVVLFSRKKQILSLVARQ